MRIVFLTQKFPLPLDNGGNIRTFHLLKGLASRHQVSLIAERPVGMQERDLREVTKFCEAVDLVEPRPASFLRDVVRGGWNLLDQRPYVLMRHYNPRLLVALRQRMGDVTFQGVHLNHLDAAMYLPDVRRPALVVIDQHNVVTNQVERTIPLESNRLRRFALLADRPRIRRIEAQACNDASAILACSQVDAENLAQLGVKTPVSVVSNGVDLEQFRPVSVPKLGGSDMVFVGALDYDPCDKGVRYFCERILPLIVKRSPKARFIVVGRNPSKALQALARSSGAIVLTGSVPDVRPHVQGATVFVVPLLSGSGTRLKILEAMAMGVPLVTTSVGVEGIAAIEAEHCMIADEPERFAESVLRLMADEALARKIAANARRLVEQRYGWQRSVDDMLEVYSRLEPAIASGYERVADA